MFLSGREEWSARSEKVFFNEELRMEN